MDAIEMNALDVLVARSTLPAGLAVEFAASVPAVLCHNQQACSDPQVVEALFDPALFTDLAVSTSGAGAQRFVELLADADPATAAPVLRGLSCRPKNCRWPAGCLEAVLDWMEPSVTARPFTFRDEFTELAAAPWLSLEQRLAVARFASPELRCHLVLRHRLDPARGANLLAGPAAAPSGWPGYVALLAVAATAPQTASVFAGRLGEPSHNQSRLLRAAMWAACRVWATNPPLLAQLVDDLEQLAEARLGSNSSPSSRERAAVDALVIAEQDPTAPASVTSALTYLVDRAGWRTTSVLERLDEARTGEMWATLSAADAADRLADGTSELCDRIWIPERTADETPAWPTPPRVAEVLGSIPDRWRAAVAFATPEGQGVWRTQRRYLKGSEPRIDDVLDLVELALGPLDAAEDPAAPAFTG